MTDRSFTDATIVVLGATGAFGSRITRRLADAGAKVVATGRDGSRLENLPAATTVVADLTDPGAVGLILEAAGPHVDGFINAAGVVAFGALSDTSADVIDRLFTVNTTAPLRIISGLLPRLADGGFIASISGVVAEQPMAGLTPYSASKAAIGSAMVALRRELRKQKIDVIDLRPPHTETGLADRPLSGTAPGLPQGADPDAVVDVMIEAIRTGAREAGPKAFA